LLKEHQNALKLKIQEVEKYLVNEQVLTIHKDFFQV